MKSARFDNRVTICCSEALAAKLRAAAERSLTSTSDYARQAIVQRLEREGFIPPAGAAGGQPA